MADIKYNVETVISLFVWHDSFEIDHFERTGRLTFEEAEEARKNSGYYFELEGTAWTRACETVNFFVALRKAGYRFYDSLCWFLQSFKRSYDKWVRVECQSHSKRPIRHTEKDRSYF